MASRYFIGSGTWDAINTANWSATSGGATGASVPTSADSVFIDALSGSSPVITVSTASANCLDLNFTGAITPTFAGNQVLNIYGSLTFISAMTLSLTGTIVFAASTTGKTITLAGKTLQGNVNFNGVGGGWTHQDDININNVSFDLTNGSLIMIGRTFTGQRFTSNYSTTRSLDITNSTINTTDIFNYNGTGLTLTSTGSTINFNGASKTFTNNGCVFNNVNIVGNNAIIAGNGTCALFTPTAGNTINFTSGTTQIATTNFVFKNNTIRSTIASSAATLSKSSGAVVFRGCSVKDITGSGGATYSAIRSSTNVSGNTGITFGSYVVVEKQLDGRKYVLNASGVLTAL